MPEHLFNLGVVTVARAHLGMATPLPELIIKVSRGYLRSFVDDGFPVDMCKACVALIQDISKRDDLSERYKRDAALRHMQFFLSTHNIDGTRRKWRLLNGARFTGRREPVSHRLARFEAAYFSFLYLYSLDKIPPLPSGWRL